MINAFDDYQHKALATAAVRQKGRAGKTWAALEFGSEALELAALITSTVCKSQFRPKGKEEQEFKLKLEDELGDALWTIAVLSAQFDISLGKLAQQNLSKVGHKHADIAGKVEKGDKDGGNKILPVVEGPRGIHPKPKDPFPWTKGNKKAIKNCPKCGTETAFKEGCVSCQAPDCGWSAC
jgi:NTP pyrophosphatase (non-canonical NTP hydrolase)